MTTEAAVRRATDPLRAAAPQEPQRDGDGLRRAVAAVAFTYLLLTAPALVFAWLRAGETSAWMLAATALHAGLLLLFRRWSAPGAYPANRLAELLPLLVIPFLYAELPLLIAGLGSAYRDGAIQAVEAALFGEQPARTLAARLPWRALSELLHLAYVSYYPLLYLPALWAAWHGDGRRVRELMFVLLLAFTSFYVIFAVYPVQGPRYLWPAPDAVPAGPARWLVLHILEGGSSRGTAFPSAHMGVSVAVALLIARWHRGLGAAIGLVVLGLGVGAVYGGFHYAVDMIVGAMLGAAVFAAARALARRVEGPER